MRAAKTKKIDTGRDRGIRTGLAVVKDPYDASQSIEVTVNRRVDTLANERATGRITQGEFLTGRMLQSVWEGATGSRVRSADWAGSGSRSTLLDGLSAADARAISSLVQAREADAWEAKVREIVGVEGVQVLRSVLCGHGYFADIARNEGRTGDRAAAQVAALFRWMLCKVTNALQTATGADTGRIR